MDAVHILTVNWVLKKKHFKLHILHVYVTDQNIQGFCLRPHFPPYVHAAQPLKLMDVLKIDKCIALHKPTYPNNFDTLVSERYFQNK